MTSSSERLDAMARQVQAGDYDPVEMLALAAKEIRWLCRHIDANSIVRMSAENTAAHIDKYVAAARAGNNASD